MVENMKKEVQDRIQSAENENKLQAEDKKCLTKNFDKVKDEIEAQLANACDKAKSNEKNTAAEYIEVRTGLQSVSMIKKAKKPED